ncbi:AAA family ATPase [Solirubrobacter sp. CPCC 204708]|uniref:AAA family ATPase n=1 Tax=Solirubrobacter deserti TaxID=2282478 RepID=A0ABT4RQV5_9ACTN|nr:AAA family ATPase [Solirubrobacter deserti]MBE2320725.1 AAA family ATPase [Solirubrobacter deserti]MDA0140949.1 AAA family ATPase [Solirubrobacter deserti]
MAPTRTPLPSFVGREAELAALKGALAEARAGRARVAVVTGEAGIGKSTLLARLQHELGEPAVRAVAVSGDAAEQELPLGIVEQLLRRLGARAVPADHIAAGTALLEELATADRTTVAIVDDAHWADAPSLAALAFVARRLVDDHVLLVLATRSPATLPDALAKAPARVDLRALTVEEVAALAPAELPPRAVKRLHAHTGGNPLYTRELLHSLPADAWSDGDRPLPAPESFSALVAERVAAAADGTRALVEAAAILGSRPSLAVAAQLAGADDPLAALDEARAVGLLTWDGVDHLGFPHPLVPAAVVDGLGAARRAALHVGASELVEDESEAMRHLAAATLRPDEAVAQRLEAFAHRPQAARDRPAAAAALAAASRLSTARSDRERRLMQAVEWWFLAGDLSTAQRHADEVARMAESPRRDLLLARFAMFDGRYGEAADLIAAAWERVDAHADPVLAAQIAYSRAFSALIHLDDEQVVHWAGRAPDLGPGHPSAGGWPATRALAQWRLGQGEAARATIAAVAPVNDGVRTELTAIRGWLAYLDDDIAAATVDLRSAVDAELRFGSYSQASVHLAVLARAHFAAGGWGEAVVAAERAVALTAELHQPAARPFAWWAAVLVPAARGEWEVAEHYARLAAEAPPGPPDRLVATGITRALLHAARGEPQHVVEALSPVAALDVAGAANAPGFWPWQHLYAEALVLVDRVEEADAFLHPHERRARARRHRSMLGRLARVRGQLEAARGEREEAEAAFVRSKAQFEPLGMPYELALTRLAHGQLLRRVGQRRAAREELTAARDRLAALDAWPALKRCKQELTAAGAAAGDTGGPPQLTAQEQAVATVVARGLTNREAAQELMISARTVEVHLSRIYAKLGISSRNALAERLRTGPT